MYNGRNPKGEVLAVAQMIRKQIYIQRRQEAQLKRLAKQRGMSEAEIIRRALDNELNVVAAPRVPSDPLAWEKALAFMRSLHARGPLPNRRRDWKREDLYEERMNRYDRHSH
jgi:hypothetical protein